MRVCAQAAGVADGVHDGGLFLARRDDDDEFLFLLHGDAELAADALGVLAASLEDRAAHGACASGGVDGVAAVAVAERDPDGGVTRAGLHIGHFATHPFFDLLFYGLAQLVVHELEQRPLQPRDRDRQHDAAAALMQRDALLQRVKQVAHEKLRQQPDREQAAAAAQPEDVEHFRRRRAVSLTLVVDRDAEILKRLLELAAVFMARDDEHHARCESVFGMYHISSSSRSMTPSSGSRSALFCATALDLCT